MTVRAAAVGVQREKGTGALAQFEGAWHQPVRAQASPEAMSDGE
jgi:hypothetical protein